MDRPKMSAGFGSGKIGQAVELDGTDDWVYVPDYTKVSGAMTASAGSTPLMVSSGRSFVIGCRSWVMVVSVSS